MRHFLHMIGKLSLLLLIYCAYTQAYAQIAYRDVSVPDRTLEQDENERALKQVLLEFQ